MHNTLLLLDFDGTLAHSEGLGKANISRVMAKQAGLDKAELLAFVKSRHGLTVMQYLDELNETFNAQLKLDEILTEHAATLYDRFRKEGVMSGEETSIAH